MDSDFEDKCREISKNRRIVKKVVNVIKDGKNSKVDVTTTPVNEKSEKKDATSTSGSLIVNGRKFSSSRKRRIPAWARGYVKKPHKKKKISFEDSTCDQNQTPKTVNGDTTGEFC